VPSFSGLFQLESEQVIAERRLPSPHQSAAGVYDFGGRKFFTEQMYVNSLLPRK